MNFQFACIVMLLAVLCVLALVNMILIVKVKRCECEKPPACPGYPPQQTTTYVTSAATASTTSPLPTLPPGLLQSIYVVQHDDLVGIKHLVPDQRQTTDSFLGTDDDLSILWFLSPKYRPQYHYNVSMQLANRGDCQSCTVFDADDECRTSSQCNDENLVYCCEYCNTTAAFCMVNGTKTNNTFRHLCGAEYMLDTRLDICAMNGSGFMQAIHIGFDAQVTADPPRQAIINATTHTIVSTNVRGLVTNGSDILWRAVVFSLQDMTLLIAGGENYSTTYEVSSVASSDNLRLGTDDPYGDNVIAFIFNQTTNQMTVAKSAGDLGIYLTGIIPSSIMSQCEFVDAGFVGPDPYVGCQVPGGAFYTYRYVLAWPFGLTPATIRPN